MGMESFYVNIIFSSEKDVNSAFDLLQEHFDIKIKNGATIIEKWLFLEKDKVFKSISLEACLSDYFNNIGLMYKIYFHLNNRICLKIKIGKNDFKVQLTAQEFESAITDFFKEKYNLFTAKYGNASFQSLPGDDFYKLIRKQS